MSLRAITKNSLKIFLGVWATFCKSYVIMEIEDMLDVNAIKRTKQIIKTAGLQDEYKRISRILKAKKRKSHIVIFEDEEIGNPEFKFYTLEVMNEVLYKGSLSTYDLEFIASSKNIDEVLRECEDWLVTYA